MKIFRVLDRYQSARYLADWAFNSHCKIKPPMRKAFYLSLLLLLIGCDKSFNSLSIDVEPIGSIHIYDKVEIKWTVNGRKPDDTRLHWVSADPYIASITDNIVTGIHPGRATLNLYLFGKDNNSSADVMLLESTVVTVTDYFPESVRVDPGSLEIYVGEHRFLSAMVLPYASTQQGISWTSSDKNIAEVSQTGMVVGKKAGKATIRATSTANPSAFSECALTVK